jgi:putative cell wall-binding protein
MHIARLTAVLGAVAIAIASPVGAGAVASASVALAPATGTIAGTVSDTTGAPIVHACVQVYINSTPWLPVVYTDAQGSYTVVNVGVNQIDAYTVRVDASCGTGANSLNYLRFSSPSVYVATGKTVTVNAVLSLGGSIAGRVLLSGSPLAGVCVDASLSGGGVQVEEAMSSADGSYIVSGVPADSYIVAFQVCSGDFAHTNIQPVSYGQHPDGSGSPLVVSAGQRASLGDQTVQPGGEIDIKLTDTTGHALTTDVFPVVQLIDRSYAGATGGAQSNVPDANGYWRTIGLLPKAYEIDYYYCALQCRQGPIGYYAGRGVGGVPTPVSVAAGGIVPLTDVVSIPAVSTSVTALTALPATPTQGDVVTFAATITDPQTGAVPTGAVEFLSNYGGLGTAMLDSHGVATVMSNILPAGSDLVWTVYLGDGESDLSQAQITMTVMPPTGGGGGGGGAAPASPVSVTVLAGGSVSSDPAGAKPDSSNPLVLTVTSPVAGLVGIDKTPPGTAVPNYTVLGVGATVTAPAATVANPLQLTFAVFDGSLPAGAHPSDLTVFRNGVPVAACTGTGATPDPCVGSGATAGGITTIDVRTSHASTWDVEAAKVGREFGVDRIATAVAVSQDSFPAVRAGAVVLARADDYPDALVGAPLAAARNAPLLLTQGPLMPSATVTELQRVLPAGGTVYVLGGTAAVPVSVADQLAGLGYQVVRYAGADRYATALAVAGALGNPGTVFLATGTNFPDALSAGPAAAHVHGAVLLTNGSALPSTTAAYVAHATTVYAIGGPAAAAAPSAVPIVGADRYATAAAAAVKFFGAATTAGVATGVGFPDALTGGAQLALAGAPLLLSTPTSVPASTIGYLSSNRSVLTNVRVYGGAAVLSDAVISQLTAAAVG